MTWAAAGGIAGAVIYAAVAAILAWRARHFSRRVAVMVRIYLGCTIWPVMIMVQGFESFWENT